jgi:anti-sigma regulatory factor (Ser/Thr protein kinase)
MCHQAETTLWSKPSSVAVARGWVTGRLDEWKMREHRDEMELVASELVTNALPHASEHIALALSVAHATLELRVHDDNHRLPRRAPPRSSPRDATSGRGLFILDRVCDEWGVAKQSPGKDVWVRFVLNRPSHCECA